MRAIHIYNIQWGGPILQELADKSVLPKQIVWTDEDLFIPRLKHIFIKNWVARVMHNQYRYETIDFDLDWVE